MEWSGKAYCVQGMEVLWQPRRLSWVGSVCCIEKGWISRYLGSVNDDDGGVVLVTDLKHC